MSHSTLNAFNFTQSAESDYLHAAWDVKDGVSPFRAAIEKDRELEVEIANPKTMMPCLGELKRTQTVEIFEKPVYAEDYWLKDKRNNLVLKQIVDRLGEESDSGTCAVQMDRVGLVHLKIMCGLSLRQFRPEFRLFCKIGLREVEAEEIDGAYVAAIKQFGCQKEDILAAWSSSRGID